MRMCVKRLGLAAVFCSVALVALTGACYAKEDAWLGVVLQPLSEDLKDAMDIDGDIAGVLVSDVVSDSPADEYGIEDGDVIISIGGDETGTVTKAVRAIKGYSPGDAVEIVILRDGGRKRTFKVKLGERDEDKIGGMDREFYKMPDIKRAFQGWMDESQGFLGVQIHDMTADLAEYFDVDEGEGVLVLEVTEDSPADEAGLKGGDVILEFDGVKVDDTDELVELVREGDPGDDVRVKIKRKRRVETVDVELGETENAAKVYVKQLMEPGGGKRIIMPRGQDIDIGDLDDQIEIHKLHQDDLREELKQLRKEVEELRKEIQKIRES